MSLLLKSARDSGSDSGKTTETQVQIIHPASPRLSEAAFEGRRDGRRDEPIVVEDNWEGWIEEIDGLWQENVRQENVRQVNVRDERERDHQGQEQCSDCLPSVHASSHRAPSLKASHTEKQSILDDANDYCDNLIAGRDSRRNSGRERERGSGREREERDSQRSSDLKPISEKNKIYAMKMKLFSMYQPEKKRKSSKTANAGTRNLDRRKSQNSVARLSSGSGDVLDYFRDMGFDETAGFDMLIEADLPRVDEDGWKSSRQGTPSTGPSGIGRSRDSGRSYMNVVSKEDGTDLESVLGLKPGQEQGQSDPIYSTGEGLYGRNSRKGSLPVSESERQRCLDSDTDTEVFYRMQRESPQAQGRRVKYTAHSAYAPSKYNATHTAAWSQTVRSPACTDVTSRYALSATMPTKQFERQGLVGKMAVSPVQKR
jgi:hypothetical protein